MKRRPGLKRWAALTLCLFTPPAIAQSLDWRAVPAQPVRAGLGPSTLALVELNGDGRLDLLTGHQVQKRVGAWLGDGRGAFSPASGGGVTPGYETGAFAPADLNADGKADLVIASRDQAGEYVQVWVNDGHGGFPRPVSALIRFSAAGEFYKPVLLFADFNEDGRLDLIAGNGRREALQVLFGDGAGGLAPGPLVRMHDMPARYYVAVDDVNGDGHADIVAPATFQTGRSAELAVKLGDGKGGFRETSPRAQLKLGLEGARTELVDMDGDGKSDLLLSHGRRIDVLRGDGQGRFDPSGASPGVLPTDVFTTQVADLNGDGRKDIVVATVDSVTVLLAGKDGYKPAAGSPFRAGPASYNVTLGDVDGDRRPDILTSSLTGDTLGVLLSR